MIPELLRLYNHPRGLMSLCLIELWERFAFYGMRSVLILYMIYTLHFKLDQAYSIYAAAIALSYATPLIGGFLADRLLGLQRSIVLGSLAMMVGYVCLALENISLFYSGLALIIVGTGLFKPNLSTMVGSLYKSEDPRRDAGYTLFYVSINIGAFLAPLACGSISHLFGWSYGVGFTAFGMLMSFIIMLWVFKQCWAHPLSENGQEAPPAIRSKLLLTVGGLIAAVPLLAILLKHPHIFDATMPIIAIGVIIILCALAFYLKGEDRKRLGIIAVLMGFQIVFFALFEQEGSSLAVFADGHVNRTVFGFTLPTSFLQALNPAFTLLFAPILAGVWAYLGRQGRDLTPPIKFSLALMFVGLGFGALMLGVTLATPQQQISLVWIAIAFLCHSLGEFCIAPVGMSMVSKLAPKHLASFLMGLWFSSFSFAHYLAGVIARFIGRGEGAVKSLHLYLDAFQSLAIVAMFFAALLILLAYKLHPFLRDKLK